MVDARYNVYDAKTGLPLIVCGTTVRCANVLGMKVHSFRCQASKQLCGRKHGGNTKYIIERFEVDDE